MQAGVRGNSNEASNVDCKANHLVWALACICFALARRSIANETWTNIVGGVWYAFKSLKLVGT